MKKRAPTTGRKGAKQTIDIEWLGGIVTMPAYVTEEGDPYRPEMLVWMGHEGHILGSQIGKPGEVLALASESLQRTFEQPVFGPPHMPSRLRVASLELANVLRRDHPTLNVVCAPTPELDEMHEHMSAKFNEDAPDQSYLSPEISAEAMAAFFAAAATLFRAAPWKLVPGDQSLIFVTVESLDVRNAVISVIGQQSESFGFILFNSIDDAYAYMDAAYAFEQGQPIELPATLALNFDRGADVPPELRKEIATHHWEVASPSAYPWLVRVDEDLERIS